MDRKTIKKIINIYLPDLSKSIKIDKAIVFGSSLSGKIGKHSDIDLLIISSKFKQMDSSSRFDILYMARKNPLTQNAPMDIFGLTSEEYNNANTLSIIGEIKDQGEIVMMGN